MHKIYFEKRCIIICEPSDQALSDPNSIEFHAGDHIDIHTLVTMFKASESLSRIYIPTESARTGACALSSARSTPPAGW